MTIPDIVELVVRALLRENTGDDKLSAAQVKELSREKRALFTEIDPRAKSDKVFSMKEVKKAVKGTPNA